MKGSVFDYGDYKRYLCDVIESRRLQGRKAERSRLAEALRCHLAYLSRVLNGGAHLSLEQAHALNTHLGHSGEEGDFFLLLVGLARAGTPELRGYYQSKIKAELVRRSQLKNRLGYRRSLPEADQATYFSTWHYAAVHLLLAIPGLRTKESLAAYLQLSTRRVGDVLRFLCDAGLAVEKEGRFETGRTSIHLGNDSPMIAKHHLNWRLLGMQSFEQERLEELHYTSAITLSRAHVPEVRKVLVAAIERVRAIVAQSPEEALYCYSLDLFQVGGPHRL